jgi:hypothetical protein
MDRLVDAYLLYGVYKDGELLANPPLPENPSTTFDMEVVDIFCELIHLISDYCT